MSLKNATKTDVPNRVEMEVEVDAAAFEAAVTAAFRKNIGRMNVPGFRKGKAPRHLVERLYGENVFYEEAVNALYPEALDAAIAESGYEYIEDEIGLDVVSVGKEGLVFKAVVTVKPEVSIEGYRGLSAPKVTAEVTEDEVDGELAKMRERGARLVPVEDRPAADGDTVTFDFDGSVDGVPFDGGKSEGFELVLGSGQFIPGFEEQIAGKNIGDSFDVNVTFPEEYHAEELAGKAAVFACTLHGIKVKELPELDDEFAKDFSEQDTLEELRVHVREHLEEHKKADAERTFENALADGLAERLEGDIPSAMFEREIDQKLRDFDMRMQAQGMNMQTYMQFTGMDPAAMRENFREQAEKQVKVRLALEKIAQLEDLTPTAEELETQYGKYAEQYSMEAEKLKELLPEKDITRDLAVEKAFDVVKDAAVITEAAE